MDILGKDSALIGGLKLKDSMGLSANNEAIERLETSMSHEEEFSEESDQTEKENIPPLSPRPSPVSQTPTRSTSAVVSRPCNISAGSKRKVVVIGSSAHKKLTEKEELSEKKLKLQIAYLEKQNYKTDLEIYQLEKLLNLRPSKHTENLSEMEVGTSVHEVYVFDSDAGLIRATE